MAENDSKMTPDVKRETIFQSVGGLFFGTEKQKEKGRETSPRGENRVQSGRTKFREMEKMAHN